MSTTKFRPGMGFTPKMIEDLERKVARDKALEPVIVTRHEALTEYLVEMSIAPAGAEVIPHAGADDVRGRHVIGVLPLHLAALTASLTVVPLDIPREMRGVELTLEQVREMAGDPVTYTVTEGKPKPPRLTAEEGARLHPGIIYGYEDARAGHTHAYWCCPKCGNRQVWGHPDTDHIAYKIGDGWTGFPEPCPGCSV